jgi:hypothetical protein
MLRRLLLLLAVAGLATACESSLSGPDQGNSAHRVIAQPADDGGIGANNGS